jgi:hypothetical protein
MREIAMTRQFEGALENAGALPLSPKGALTHHCPVGAAVVLALGKSCALRGESRLLREPPVNATSLRSVVIARADGWAFCVTRKTVVSVPKTTRRLPVKTCHRQVFTVIGGAPPMFSFAKENQKTWKDGDAQSRSTI